MAERLWMRASWSAALAITFLCGQVGSAQSVTAPAAAKFSANTSNQSASGFVVSWPNTSDILYGTIYIDNPPAGTSLNFSSTPSGLTAAAGYTSSLAANTSFTTVAFTGNVTSFNNALSTLRVTTGGTNGNFTIVVTATANPADTYYNPRNGHWYRYVSGKPSTSGSGGFTQIKTAAAGTTFKGKSGYLVSLSDSSEHNFVYNNVPGNDILIGLTDAGSEGNWRWDQGPDSGTVIRTGNGGVLVQQAGQTAGSPNVAGKYNNWCSGEPNDWGSGENYAVTKWGGGSCWNDYGPPASNGWGSVSGYVIEFGTAASASDQSWTEFYRSSVAHFSSTATKLNITTSAAGAASAAAFTTQPVIQLRDGSDNAVSQAGILVTMTVSAGAEVVGTATATTDASGVATFSGVGIAGTAGTSYTLTFAAAGLTSATQSITPTAGVATQLSISAESRGTSGSTIPAPGGPRIRVYFRDAYNYFVPSTDSVTLAIATNPAGGTLSGQTKVAAVGGVADFDVSIDKAGSGYTLSASSGALTVTSSAIDIDAGAASQVAFTTQPVGSPSGQFLATQPVVTVQDAFGNTVTSSTASVTLTIGTNAGSGGSGLLRGTVTVAAVDGVATFSTIAIHREGVGYTLTASSAPLASATSSPFTVAAPLSLPAADVIDYKSRYAEASPSTKTGAAYIAEITSLIAVEPTDRFCDKALSSSALTTNQAQCPNGRPGDSMIRLRTTFTPTPELIGARLWVRVRGDYGRGGVLVVDGTEKLFRDVINADWASWQYSPSTTLPSGSTIIDWMGFEDCCDGGVSMEWSTDSLTWATASATVTVSQLTLSAPADLTLGGARAAYTVSRRDASGNLASPATSQTVYLSATGGTLFNASTGGSTIASVVIGSGQSQATFYFAATMAGSYTVTASDATPADGATGLADATDAIGAAAGPAAALRKLGTDDIAVAVGTAAVPPPAVRVVDANGYGVPDASVTFSVSGGGGIVGPAVIANLDAAYRTGGTTLDAGDSKAILFTTGSSSTQVARVAVLFNGSTYPASIQARVALHAVSGGDPSTVLAQSEVVSLTLSGPLFWHAFTLPTLTLAANQSYALVVSNPGSSAFRWSNSDANLTPSAFGGGVVDGARTWDASDPGWRSVIGGSPVSNNNAFFLAADVAGASSVTVTTSNTGVAALGAWMLGAAAGANSVTATHTTGTQTFAATGVAAAASQIAIVAGNSQSASPGASVATAPSVVVRDANNNPVAGVSVRFEVASGGGTVAPTTAVTTDANGVAAVTSWTLGSAVGPNALTATIVGSDPAIRTTVRATADGVVFSETFAYDAGPLVGRGGGVGFANASGWSGGTGQDTRVTGGMPGTGGTSARVFGQPSRRTLAAPVTTGVGTTTYYLSLVFNASNYRASDFAGVTLVSTAAGGVGSLFVGMPGGRAGIGFDWGSREAIARPATTSTNYLLLYEIAPGASEGTTTVRLRRTTDLTMSAADLMALADDGVVAVDKTSVTFDRLEIAGQYAGDIHIAGVALATTPALALDITRAAVPIPTQLTLEAGDGQSAAAGTEVAIVPRVRVRDASNAAVPGANVTFAVAAGGGFVFGGTVLTDASGLAQPGAWGLGETPGANALTATIERHNADGSRTVLQSTATATGTVGVPDVEVSTLLASPDVEVVANGVATSTLTLTARDAFANAVPNQPVFLAIRSGAGGTLSAGPWTTDANGVVTATLTSTTAGTVTVAGYLGPDTTARELLTTAMVEFVPGAAAKLTLTAVPSSEPVSGIPFDEALVLEVHDVTGNVVPQTGIVVTASIASGGGTLGGTLTATTDASGVATFTDLMITGPAGDRTLRFSATGLTAATTGVIALQSGLPTAAVPPRLWGTALVGETLDVDLGIWTRDPTLAVRWQRCSSDAASCVDIPGATTETRELIDADLGTRLRAVVRAQNSSGEVDSATALTEVVRELPGRPRDLTLRAADQAVEVRWTRPVREGSAPITGYAVESSVDAGETWVRAPAVTGGDQTSTRITELTNNRVYRVRVAAISTVGTGAFATADTSATPLAPVVPTGSSEPPSVAPGGVTASTGGTPQTVDVRIVGDTTVEVSAADFAMRLSALDDDAKARRVDPATGALRLEQGAQVVSVGDGFLPGSMVTIWLFSEPRQLGQALVRPDGTYAHRVPLPVDVPLGQHTLQAVGLNRAAAQKSVALGVVMDEPADIVANAPASVDASPLDGGAQLAWVPPVYAGGDPVRRYVVQLSRDGGTTWIDTVSVAAGAARPTAQVMGLTNGTSYRFRIIAVNASGRSDPSAASEVVTPFKPTPLLRIAVVSSSATPALGDTITITVTVRNEGTGAARTTVVPLPDEPRFLRVTGTASQGSVDLVAGRWSVGTLAINGEAVLTLRVVVRKGSDPQGAR